MTAPAVRYAVYLAPEAESELWRTGCRWLGRDPEVPASAAVGPPPEVGDAGIGSNEWSEATAPPRRYGFHATLKPPFALADGCRFADLDKALARFAAGRTAFAGPALEVARLDGFLALCPATPDARVDALAADCVRAFDGFRLPADAAGLARRRAGGLSARQETMLRAWGYPYVMDEFRFHMTLTARLDDAAADRFGAVLRILFGFVQGAPLTVNGVSLFREPAPGAPFELVRRYPFAAR